MDADRLRWTVEAIVERAPASSPRSSVTPARVDVRKLVARGACYVEAMAHEPGGDDKAARVVGRRRRPLALGDTGDTIASVLAFRKAFPTPFVPRGVYRFRSHEEADRWMWEMLTRPRTV
jgi:hypothetical protein